MVLLQNTLSAGPHGANMSRVSTDATGDQISYVVINNSANNNGASEIQYTNELAAHGIPMTVKVSGEYNLTYLRYDVASQPGRVVVRRAFFAPSNITSLASVPFITIRSTEGWSSGIRLDQGRPVLRNKNAYIVATRSPTAVPAETLLWVQVAVTPESDDGVNDGIAEYRITDAAGVVLFEYVQTNADVSAGNINEVRFGGQVLGGWDFLGDVQVAHLASGWLGPIEETVPLSGLAPSITSHVRPSIPGASDGSITISWDPVPNAASYEVYLDSGTGPMLVSTTATSPHTFVNLAAGEYEPFVQAMP